jgi:hypothetical protein
MYVLTFVCEDMRVSLHGCDEVISACVCVHVCVCVCVIAYAWMLGLGLGLGLGRGYSSRLPAAGRQYLKRVMVTPAACPQLVGRSSIVAIRVSLMPYTPGQRAVYPQVKVQQSQS